MAKKSILNPCDRCGGRTDKCFYGQPQSDQPVKIVVVTERPEYVKTTFSRLQGYFQGHGIDINGVLWTSVVRCFGKSVAKAKTNCREELWKEIDHYKPAVVITVGADVLKHLYGAKYNMTMLTTHVPTVMTQNSVSYRLLHIDDLDTLMENPEKVFRNDWVLSKIGMLLDGSYDQRRNNLLNNHYYAVLSEAELDHFIERYKDYEYMAFDIETQGTHPELGVVVHHDPYSRYKSIIGASFCVCPGEAAFIDFTIVGRDVALKFLNWIKGYKIVCQNGQFDLTHILMEYGVDLWDNFHFDTLLADHLLRVWDKTHRLKYMAALYVPEFEDYDKPLEDFFRQNKISEDKRDYGLLPKHLLYPYGCMDSDVTLRLFYTLSKKLHDEGRLDFMLNHIMRMQRAYAEMQVNGWGLDEEEWVKIRDEVTAQKLAQDAKLRKHETWNGWILHTEAKLRAEGKAFYDPKTNEIYTDSSCNQYAEPTYTNADGKLRQRKRKNGTVVKAHVYTLEDITPDPTTDAFKREVLYSEYFLNLTPQRFTDKKSTPKVDDNSLRELRQSYGHYSQVTALIDAMQELERCQKLLTTYITPVFPHPAKNKPEKILPGWCRDDGLVHCDYVLAGQDFGSKYVVGGTTSGRISGKNPNLTNIPTRRGGKRIKKMFVPIPRSADGLLVQDNEPWVIVQADYSQLELRTLADLSKDGFMVTAYQNDEDLHTKLACQQNDKPLAWFEERLHDHTNPEHEQAFDLRHCAKTSWFMMIYGSGPGSLQDTLRKDGVFKTIDECQNLVTTLKSTLTQVEMLRTKVIQSAPLCITPFGRPRLVQNAFSTVEGIRSSAYRQLFNHLIQSTASDIVSIGLYLVAEWLRTQRQHTVRSYMMGSVHDSGLLSVPLSELDYIVTNVKHLMENPPLPWDFCIPFKVDVEVGPNWGDLREWEQNTTAQQLATELSTS